MKTLQDLYIEVKDDDEKKQAFVEAMKADAIQDFLKQNDCDATEDEVREFLEMTAAEDSPMELSMEELEEAAGGTDAQRQTVHMRGGSNTCIADCC